MGRKKRCHACGQEIQYKWKKLFTCNRKYFIDELTGQYALADASGMTPDVTDDGVIWINAGQPIVITCNNPYEITCTLPCVDDINGLVTVTCGMKEAARVAVELDMEVEIHNQELERLFAQIVV